MVQPSRPLLRNLHLEYLLESRDRESVEAAKNLVSFLIQRFETVDYDDFTTQPMLI